MRLTEQLRERVRAFVLGPGVVNMGEDVFGHDNSTYTPGEYGDYIATSNAVYACATLRARLLAKLPLRLYRVQSNGKRVDVERGKTYDLLRKVNPFWTFKKLLYMTELDRSLWGAYFWYLERGQSGRLPPAEIWRGRPDRSTVVPDAANYVRGYVYKPGNGQADIAYLPGEVIWGPLPNPLDEYSGLSPLAAARLAADYASAAQKSNRNLFANGLQMGGIITPKSGSTLTPDQAMAIEKLLTERFKGVNNAHRWGVFRFEADAKPLGMSPKDAEYIEGQRLALEDVCRAYGVPQDLVGGQRTYENVQAAMRAIWTQTVLPEADMIASDISEQLLPLLGEADVAEFDASDIEELQESTTEKWTRTQGQLKAGALTINEYRSDEGLDAVAWGDVWWAPSSLTPVTDGEKEPPPPQLAAPVTEQPAADTEGPEEPTEPTEPERSARAAALILYGSPAHLAHWQRTTARLDREERKVYAMVQELARRQQSSVLARLRKRSLDDAVRNPFDLGEWTRKFREEARVVFRALLAIFGAEAVADVGGADDFSVTDPAAVRFLERSAQRFAVEVTESCWNELRASLVEALDSGESVAEVEERVRRHFAQYIGDPEAEGKAARAEMIARTETNRALNGGTLEGWRQSGLVSGKTWISALDDRTRTPPASEFDHVGAHGETVGLDEQFVATGEPLDGPGLGGSAGNVINCRCSMAAVLKE